MQFTRRHSTRDFFGTVFFGVVIYGIMLLFFMMYWVKGEIPITIQDPLSILGTMIIVGLFPYMIVVSRRHYTSPWYIHISCNADEYVFIARNAEDNRIIKKTDLISTQLIHKSLPGYGGAVWVQVNYLHDGEQRPIFISGGGSWCDQSQKVFRQVGFCKALMAALKS